MENATDALIMAGSIFLLIIALTLSISSFSRVKTQIDDIVLSKEKVEYAVNSDDNSLLNFIQSNNNYTRVVQFETIATSLRRLRKEEFDVYIIFKDSDDLTQFANEIRTTLQQDPRFDDIHTSLVGKSTLRFSISGTANKYLEDKNSDNFDKTLKLLYNKVNPNSGPPKEFYEYYGFYKQKTDDGVSNIEKKDIKIITYMEK